MKGGFGPGVTKQDSVEHLFDNLRHARPLIVAWRTAFNHYRPHTSLADLTPAEYANRSKEGQYLNRANLN